VGKSVFTKCRGVNVLKSSPLYVPGVSTDQAFQRSCFLNTVTAYKSYAPSLKKIWEDLAKPLHMTGFDLHNKQNINRWKGVIQPSVTPVGVEDWGSWNCRESDYHEGIMWAAPYNWTPAPDNALYGTVWFFNGTPRCFSLYWPEGHEGYVAVQTDGAYQWGLICSVMTYDYGKRFSWANVIWRQF
jgi:hypothetical protein